MTKERHKIKCPGRAKPTKWQPKYSRCTASIRNERIISDHQAKHSLAKVLHSASLDQRIMPNVASNEQNQCFTVAVGAQLTISNCLTRHKVYEMQSVDEMDPTGQAVFGSKNYCSPSQEHGWCQSLMQVHRGLTSKTFSTHKKSRKQMWWRGDSSHCAQSVLWSTNHCKKVRFHFTHLKIFTLAISKPVRCLSSALSTQNLTPESSQNAVFNRQSSQNAKWVLGQTAP